MIIIEKTIHYSINMFYFDLFQSIMDEMDDEEITRNFSYQIEVCCGIYLKKKLLLLLLNCALFNTMHLFKFT